VSTVRVRDNLGLATDWIASSNQSWLTVHIERNGRRRPRPHREPSGLVNDSVNLAT